MTLKKAEMGPAKATSPGTLGCGAGGVKQEAPMSTIEIHEPEVTEATSASRAAAAVLPRTELVLGPALAPRAMFSDSLLEFGVQRKRKFFATTTSFVLNCMALGVLLVLPLAFTEELPKAQLLTFLVAPPPPPPPPPAAAEVQRVVHQIQTDLLSSGQLRTPSKIPQKVQMIKEEEAPPPMPASGGVVGGVPGGIPGGQLGGVIGGIVNSTSNLTVVPKFVPVASQRVRISQGVTKGLLAHRVEPTYPTLAKSARVQGEVILSAVINTNGEIQNLQLVSGHPMLVPAALEAVKQWRYKPYLLNGQPVEVETTITVIFALTS
ncbi:MAG TPA: energy transducer TonB [Candidatus Sulfotelmatobacter sp.]|jgi:protein TonB|nr:energy transducer TonB [Candidatus Sulfotelmatobacter sp.]